ncbi:YfcE family phosphodiesterase [Alkaliphilus metalliredigens]|uniref:YfcE family phosphodiesterase n=1 Tax=Alkaliphilus metalliredigens TaxID=208226 RepID=UPI0002EA2312|nr:YfcE family phosphodiesterase [Alkaliphilus metalliredigens]
MKIGVLGDSHGGFENIGLAMKHLGHVNLIIHTGDHYRDRSYIEENYHIKTIGVSGNCDQEGPDEVVQIIHGKKYFISHGHIYGVTHGINGIFYRGKELGADVVIFGHTHVPLNVKEEGMIILNPGSVSSPRGDSQKSCALMEIGAHRHLKVSLIELE